MILRFSMAALGLAAAASAAERVVEREFPAPAGCVLRLDTYRGNASVMPGSGPTIRVTLRISTQTADPAEATRLFDRLQLAIDSAPGSISIVARNPAETRVAFDWNASKRLRLEYAIVLPASCAVSVTTQDGSLFGGNLSDRVELRTRHGSISLRAIDGDATASADNGDIVMARCTGNASLTTTLGGIRAGSVFGHAEVRTRNGDIELQHAIGGVNASAEAGDVQVGFPKDVKGSRVTTNGGEIAVLIDRAAALDLQASSVWGKVHTTLPFAVRSGGDGKKELEGRLNGGGPLLVLHADGGQVRISAPRY